MKKILVTAAAMALVSGGTAYAQDYAAELKARQGQFRVLAINLGILGSMAKGETEYSAEAAQAAADSVLAVSMINQGPLWPAGSDEMGIDGTRAKTSIWENNADFLAKWTALGEAAKVLQAAAGTGQAAIGPALGGVGGTCQACHEAHRAPVN